MAQIYMEYIVSDLIMINESCYNIFCRILLDMNIIYTSFWCDDDTILVISVDILGFFPLIIDICIPYCNIVMFKCC